MRCLCSRKSSYIVTTVKTPPVPSKVSKVRSFENSLPNGIDASESRINGQAPANTQTNDIGTSKASTTEVQVHNNQNDDVTRYNDTSKTVAREFTNVSTSKSSTPQGTLKKNAKAPQPPKGHAESQGATPSSENLIITSSTPPELQVTNHQVTDTHVTTSKFQATSPKTSGNRVTFQKTSESHRVIPERKITPINGSENQSSSSHSSQVTVTISKSSENEVMAPDNIHETYPKTIEEHVASPKASEVQQLIHQTHTSESQPISHNNSESHISPKTSINRDISHTALDIDVTSPKTSESQISSHKIYEIDLATSGTTSIIKSSHTSINVTSTEISNNVSSIENVITEPVTENNITYHSSAVTSSESGSSVVTAPVTKETVIHTSSTVSATGPLTETITNTLSMASDQESETSLITTPVAETTTYSSSTANESKTEQTTSSTAHLTQKDAGSGETLEETTTHYITHTLTNSKSETSLLSVPSPTNTLSKSSSMSSIVDATVENLESLPNGRKESVGELLAGSNRSSTSQENEVRRRSGVQVSVLKGPEVTSEEELPMFKKSLEDEEKIRKAIEKNEFLSKILSGKRLQDIINAMQPKNVIAKQKLVKQGEKGSEMFVSKEGSFKILIKGKVVAEFSDSRVFGELAILYNAKRLASIQAASTGKVWVLDRHVYQKIVISSNLREQDENLKFLQNVESLNVVNVEVLRQVSNLLKPEFCVAGTVIIRQGDKGDKFYIIRAGTVTISKTGEGLLGKLGKGQCFGEMALQKEDTRQATVTAEAPGVECLTLTRADFINHFGDVEIPKIEVKKTSFRDDAPSEYQDIKLEDLKIVKTLGVGGFGRVELVQHKKKKDHIFALKYLKKIDIVYQNQQEHVYNEKLIQMNSKSPFIVRLYRTYKDNKYVYFLMESCLGGDLFSLLHRQKGKRFDERDARFLSACVLEALEHLHSKGVVYRDLKPENLLIDKHGYLKLTDFGFAKKMPARGKTFTFAGTPEYVAPEIVLNRGHDKAVDYWAFGAFIFELLSGRTPFRTGDSSHMRTYNKILNGIDNVNFPTYMNPKARNLIEKLCRPVPAERMGMQRGGTRDIKAHKWYQGFEWVRFQQLQIPSPFKPKLRDLTDTSNFDLFKQDKDYPPDETSGWDIHF